MSRWSYTCHLTLRVRVLWLRPSLARNYFNQPRLRKYHMGTSALITISSTV
jgi:hypothetical protein